MTENHTVHGGVLYLPSHPLDLDKIAESGQCFRWTRLGLQKYAVPFCGGKIIIEQMPGMGLNIETYGAISAGHAIYYLDMDSDYAAFWACLDTWAKREPESYLTRAADAARGLVILNQDPFETLISYIISQNNNIPRIRRIIERLCNEFGTHRSEHGQTWCDFPAPEALTDERALRHLGLGYRAGYVSAAARAVGSGELDLESLKTVPFEEACLRLKQLPGVGDKVATCVCLYGLGHKEAFPVDVWIRRVLEREFSAGFPFERYIGFGGLVQQIIFYYEREGAIG